MTVKIEGMELPKSCGNCPICSTDTVFNYDKSFDIYECPFVGTVDPDKRHKACPLQEVKE